MTSERERLIFGNEQHIEWCANAAAFRSDLRHLQTRPYRIARRKWNRPGKVCRFCGQPIQKGQMYKQIGKQVYHDECSVNRLSLCRRVCAALGMEAA